MSDQNVNELEELVVTALSRCAACPSKTAVRKIIDNLVKSCEAGDLPELLHLIIRELCAEYFCSANCNLHDKYEDELHVERAASPPMSSRTNYSALGTVKLPSSMEVNSHELPLDEESSASDVPSQSSNGSEDGTNESNSELENGGRSEKQNQDVLEDLDDDFWQSCDRIDISQTCHPRKPSSKPTKGKMKKIETKIHLKKKNQQQQQQQMLLQMQQLPTSKEASSNSSAKLERKHPKKSKLSKKDGGKIAAKSATHPMKIALRVPAPSVYPSHSNNNENDDNDDDDTDDSDQYSDKEKDKSSRGDSYVGADGDPRRPLSNTQSGDDDDDSSSDDGHNNYEDLDWWFSGDNKVQTSENNYGKNNNNVDELDPISSSDEDKAISLLYSQRDVEDREDNDSEDARYLQELLREQVALWPGMEMDLLPNSLLGHGFGVNNLQDQRSIKEEETEESSADEVSTDLDPSLADLLEEFENDVEEERKSGYYRGEEEFEEELEVFEEESELVNDEMESVESSVGSNPDEDEDDAGFWEISQDHTHSLTYSKEEPFTGIRVADWENDVTVVRFQDGSGSENNKTFGHSTGSFRRQSVGSDMNDSVSDSEIGTDINQIESDADAEGEENNSVEFIGIEDLPEDFGVNPTDSSINMNRGHAHDPSSKYLSHGDDVEDREVSQMKVIESLWEDLVTRDRPQTRRNTVGRPVAESPKSVPTPRVGNFMNSETTSVTSTSPSRSAGQVNDRKADDCNMEDVDSENCDMDRLEEYSDLIHYHEAPNNGQYLQQHSDSERSKRVHSSGSGPALNTGDNEPGIATKSSSPPHSQRPSSASIYGREMSNNTLLLSDSAVEVNHSHNATFPKTREYYRNLLESTMSKNAVFAGATAIMEKDNSIDASALLDSSVASIVSGDCWEDIQDDNHLDPANHPSTSIDFPKGENVQIFSNPVLNEMLAESLAKQYKHEVAGGATRRNIALPTTHATSLKDGIGARSDIPLKYAGKVAAAIASASRGIACESDDVTSIFSVDTNERDMGSVDYRFDSDILSGTGASSITSSMNAAHFDDWPNSPPKDLAIAVADQDWHDNGPHSEYQMPDNIETDSYIGEEDDEDDNHVGDVNENDNNEPVNLETSSSSSSSQLTVSTDPNVIPRARGKGIHGHSLMKKHHQPHAISGKVSVEVSLPVTHAERSIKKKSVKKKSKSAKSKSNPALDLSELPPSKIDQEKINAAATNTVKPKTTSRKKKAGKADATTVANKVSAAKTASATSSSSALVSKKHINGVTEKLQQDGKKRPASSASEFPIHLPEKSYLQKPVLQVAHSQLKPKTTLSQTTVKGTNHSKPQENELELNGRLPNKNSSKSKGSSTLKKAAAIEGVHHQVAKVPIHDDQEKQLFEDVGGKDVFQYDTHDLVKEIHDLNELIGNALVVKKLDDQEESGQEQDVPIASTDGTSPEYPHRKSNLDDLLNKYVDERMPYPSTFVSEELFEFFESGEEEQDFALLNGEPLQKSKFLNVTSTKLNSSTRNYDDFNSSSPNSLLSSACSARQNDLKSWEHTVAAKQHLSPRDRTSSGDSSAWKNIEKLKEDREKFLNSMFGRPFSKEAQEATTSSWSRHSTIPLSTENAEREQAQGRGERTELGHVRIITKNLSQMNQNTATDILGSWDNDRANNFGYSLPRKSKKQGNVLVTTTQSTATLGTSTAAKLQFPHSGGNKKTMKRLSTPTVSSSHSRWEQQRPSYSAVP